MKIWNKNYDINLVKQLFDLNGKSHFTEWYINIPSEDAHVKTSGPGFLNKLLYFKIDIYISLIDICLWILHSQLYYFGSQGVQ